MGDIYVQSKIDVSKVQKEYAAAAKTAMEAALKAAIKDEKGLTDKQGEGYTIRIKVSEMSIEGKNATCKLSGELVRYPKEEMVSTSMKNGASADGGKPEALVARCLEAATEAMVKKALPVMKKEARS